MTSGNYIHTRYLLQQIDIDKDVREFESIRERSVEVDTVEG